MADRHHHLAAVRTRLEALGQRRVDHQRVVAAHLERVAQAAEDRAAVMLDHGRLAVNRLVLHHLAAPGLDQRLMAEAHPERGDPRLREAPDRLERDPRLVRRARPRRDDHPVVAADQQLVDLGVVVAHHLDLGPELAEVLHEVVGEAVVVVENQDPHERLAGVINGRQTVGGSAFTRQARLHTMTVE
jgi:hypothetical protein